VATRKRKTKDVPETDRQRFERVVEERAAAARYSFKHGLRENETDRGNLLGARADLARHIAFSLGHMPMKQGISYECSRCGASGSFDIEPIGEIFTAKCERSAQGGFARIGLMAGIAAVTGGAILLGRRK